MKATTVKRRRPKRVCRKLEHGDVIRVYWVGKKKREQVFHLEGPYLDVDTAEVDAAHWDEILEALGGENLL